MIVPPHRQRGRGYRGSRLPRPTGSRLIQWASSKIGSRCQLQFCQKLSCGPLVAPGIIQNRGCLERQQFQQAATLENVSLRAPACNGHLPALGSCGMLSNRRLRVRKMCCCGFRVAVVIFCMQGFLERPASIVLWVLGCSHMLVQKQVGNETITNRGRTGPVVKHVTNMKR